MAEVARLRRRRAELLATAGHVEGDGVISDFSRMHEELGEQFYFHPTEGARLLKACGRAGWRKRDGSVLWWLMLRVRKMTTLKCPKNAARR